MSTDGKDREAWVEALAASIVDNGEQRMLSAFEIAGIAAEWAERLLREYRRAQFEAIQDDTGSQVMLSAKNLQDQILRIMDRLEDDSRIPWRVATEPE